MFGHQLNPKVWACEFGIQSCISPSLPPPPPSIWDSFHIWHAIIFLSCVNHCLSMALEAPLWATYDYYLTRLHSPLHKGPTSPYVIHRNPYSHPWEWPVNLHAHPWELHAALDFTNLTSTALVLLNRKWNTLWCFFK